MQYEKDGQTFTAFEVRQRHPSVSFAPTTFAELGYTEYTPPPPLPTTDEIKAALAAAVSARLNAKANEYRYDSIHTAINAVGSHIPKFAAEGAAFQYWWGETWAHVDRVDAAVSAGLRAIPTEAQLLAELPPFVAPA